MVNNRRKGSSLLINQRKLKEEDIQDKIQLVNLKFQEDRLMESLIRKKKI